MHQKAPDQSAIAFTQPSILVVSQRRLDPSIAIIFAAAHLKRYGLSARKKRLDLLERFQIFEIHDGFHPSIMNQINLNPSGSFHVRINSPLQAHFIWEKATARRRCIFVIASRAKSYLY